MKRIFIFDLMGIVRGIRKKSLRGLALLCLAGGQLFSFNAFGQCTVGKMDFSLRSGTELCNPNLKNDVTGWFSEDVGDELKKCGDYYGAASDVKQLALTTNTLSVPGAMITSAAWKTNKGTQNEASNKVGYSAITANPKLIDPLLLEVSGKNMLVNFGASHDYTYVMGYTVQGLKPGSTATLTCTVYNLIDPASLAASVEAAASTKEIKICGQTYNPEQDKIYGQQGAIVTTGTSLNTNGSVPSGGTPTTIGYGKSAKITIRANVDNSGVATFYIGRGGGTNSIPIGITDVEVTGNIQAQITSQKSLPVCPANPVLLSLQQAYPAGTTYKWSSSVALSGADLDKPTLMIEPTEANKTYKATCEVSMGSCKTTASIDISTKTCCSMKNEAGDDVAVAETNVFYDDFGRFPNDRTYEYTDQLGKTHTMPVDGGLWSAVDQPFVTFMQPGVTTPDIKPASGNSPSDGGWMVTNTNPYSPGVYGDASGTGRGGMFIIDLSGGGHAGKVLYQRTIPGMCRGKEITFSAQFGAINANPNGVVTMKIVLRKGSPTGPVLYETQERTLNGDETPRWQEATERFTLNDDVDQVVLQVINVTDSYGNSQGDLALDDIKFTVCTPPDVAVESSLTAEELLDLCDEKPLTLIAQISETAKKYYSNNEGYLFQYTYDDPSTTDADKIKWKDLSAIQGNGSFTIDVPKEHDAFAPLAEANSGVLNVFFRVVIGDKTYLDKNRSTWESLSALSPCRAISISSIPIVAALNCAQCYKSEEINISGKSNDKTVKELKDAAGYKVFSLCPGDKVTFSTADVTTKDKDGNDYADYLIEWYESSVVNDESKRTAIAGKSVAKGSKAVDLEVTNDNTSNSIIEKYYFVKTTDNFDPSSKSCQRWDTVKVILNPTPVAPTIANQVFCANETLGRPSEADLKGTKFTDYTINWTDAGEPAASLASTTVGSTDVEYTVTDKAGCTSDPVSFNVTISKADELTTEPVVYLKSAIKAAGGQIADLLAQNANAAKSQGTSTGTLMWSAQLAEGTTAPAAGNYQAGTPTPTTSKGEQDDEVYTYYVYQEQQVSAAPAVNCKSEPVAVKVSLLGAPAPTPRDTIYCVDETPAALENNASILQLPADTKTYELVWYDEATGGTGSTTAPAVSTAAPGKTTYYVSQRDKNDPANESSRQPLNVTVYGVAKPTVAETDIVVCLNDPVTLLANKNENPSDYLAADGFRWYEGASTTPTATPPTVSTAAATTTPLTYQVSQTYTLPGVTPAQVCEGAKVDITVTVNDTEAPGDATVNYVAAESADGTNFPPLNTAGKGWTEEAGYTYYYLFAGKGTVAPKPTSLTGFAEGVPSPTCNVAALNGGSETQFYYVYRKNNTTGCSSEISTITVTISDAMPPIVKHYYYCEGATMTDLTAEVNPLPGHAASEYSILWYGTTPPASTTATPVSTGETFVIPNKTATFSGNASKPTIYYVAQKDEVSGAVSPALEVKVYVFPKPKVTIDDTDPVCKPQTIDLKPISHVDNVTGVTSFTYTYFDENGTEMTAGNTVGSNDGTYQVSASYTIPTAESNVILQTSGLCAGEPTTTKLDIHDLAGLKIAGDQRACPGRTASLEAFAESMVPGAVAITYEWSGDASVANKTGKSVVTEALSTTAGFVHKFEVTAIAGACTTKVAAPWEVTIGDGQVKGEMVFNEADNSNPQTIFKDDIEREFYSCGNEIAVSVTYENTKANSFEWYKGSAKVGEGTTYRIPADNAPGRTTYKLKFVNECDAEADFTVINVPLTASFLGDAEAAICEGEKFEMKLNVNCSETPSITWKLDGAALPQATGSESYYIQSAVESSHEGQYSFEVTNRGCSVTGNATKLDVKPYIDVLDRAEPYIVARHANQEMQVNILVPNTKLPATVDWMENGNVALQGNPVTLNDVTADHQYEIQLSDPDYCDAKTSITVWVDAELTMSVELADTMCYGEVKKLVIDTAGTGVPRQPNLYPVLKVTENVGGAMNDLTSRLRHSDGKVVVDVSPASDASYKVEFDYGSQHKEDERKIVVLPPIQLTLPAEPTICEGDSVELEVTNISPVGTVISWKSDASILTPTEDAEKVTVAPTYNASAGNDHRYRKVYDLTADFSRCETKELKVYVTVHEAMKGEITGSGAICEGASDRLDAKSFDAHTYEWTSSTEPVSSGRSFLDVTPSATATYSVAMTRGVCALTADYVLEVTSNPVIQSVDSIGIRDRKIVMLDGRGTEPFTYAIDNKAGDGMDEKFDLTFATHSVTVVDANGCTTSAKFSIEPPEITIPEYFSPNGDGTHDAWTVANLAEVYPNAVVCIFDRFGKKVAEYLGGDVNGWDGTYQGKALPSTDYWFKITIEEINREYVGHFTLMRR